MQTTVIIDDMMHHSNVKSKVNNNPGGTEHTKGPPHSDIKGREQMCSVLIKFQFDLRRDCSVLENVSAPEQEL